MLAYPIELTPDTNGTLLATFPDFREATTFGEDEADALLRAVDALETVLAARIDDREDIPLPSPHASRPSVALPALTAGKVLLYLAMREAGVRKADLARRLGWQGRRSTGCSISATPRASIRSSRPWPPSASG